VFLSKDFFYQEKQFRQGCAKWILKSHSERLFYPKQVTEKRGKLMKRRDFLKTTTAGTVMLPLIGLDFVKAEAPPQVVWVENGEPQMLVQRALQELGGIKQFISKGDVVVIKPNIGWDRAPQLAATTNPDVVAALVSACLNAGAKEVKVFDRTCNNPQRCYNSSQIEAKAKEAGAEVSHIRDTRYTNLAINGDHVKEWPIYRDYLEADKVINVPIAKHHSLSRVTLGMKNLMGVMGGNRGELHNSFSEKMAEINRRILPTLTIIDAYRILIDNGPVGGNPEHVRLKKTLIASPCVVSADYVALELFNLKPDEVDHIKQAITKGLAKYDLNTLQVKRVKLS
jgi:uncharacterized protein (DUF362 family)